MTWMTLKRQYPAGHSIARIYVFYSD